MSNKKQYLKLSSNAIEAVKNKQKNLEILALPNQPQLGEQWTIMLKSDTDGNEKDKTIFSFTNVHEDSLDTVLDYSSPFEVGDVVKVKDCPDQEITEVYLRQVQDISEHEAIAHGIEFLSNGTLLGWKDYKNSLKTYGLPLQSFRSHIIQSHGQEFWDDNNWVCVVRFREHHKSSEL